MTAGRRLPILPVLVGGLLGFIGGYFAGGGGRAGAPGGADASAAAAANPGAPWRRSSAPSSATPKTRGS